MDLMDIYMNGSTVNVGKGPEGAKLLEIIDPCGIKVMVVLPEASARVLAGALHGITLVSKMPGNTGNGG
jgi:hypothetical protein